MKQNITLAIDKELIKKARALAARQNTSISGLLAAMLRQKVDDTARYEAARRRSLAAMRAGLHLGGKGIPDRAALHDRENLR